MACQSLCLHMLSCECMDYTNGHLCKHLYGVQSMITNNEIDHEQHGRIDDGVSSDSGIHKGSLITGIS